MALFDSPRIGASGAATDYEIERSVRLNRSDDSYFEISRSSDGNRKKWTFSTWLKVANHGNDLRGIIAYNGTGNNRENLTFQADGEIAYQLRVGGSNKASVTTTGVFRDTNAWYHIVFIWDSDNGTSADRAIIYVNGVRQEVNTYITPASGASTYINSTTTHYINHDAHWGAGDYTFAETYFIDGQAYDPTYFAETDSSTGEWKPIKYTSGFSGNSFYCNYNDNSGNTSTTIGKDSSGLGNNITPFNVSVTPSSGYDSLIDTPTNNFPVFSPLYSFRQCGGSTSYSQGNLQLNTSAGSSGGELYPFGFASFGIRSGKWYAEFTCKSNNVAVGVAHTGQLDRDVTSNPYGAAASTSIIYTSRGEVRTNDAYASQSAPSYGDIDITGVALDLDNNKIYFHKNGSYINSGNPSTGSNGFTFGSVPTGVSGDFIFSCGSDGVQSITVTGNWGQQKTANTSYSDAGGIGSFNYTVPTGYKAVCFSNINDPVIPLPEVYFDVLQWTGASTVNTRDITGLDFSPDWVWIKAKSHGSYGGGLSYHHMVWDIVRGPSTGSGASASGRDLAISGTFPESSNNTYSNYYGAISSFNSNGYTVRKHSGEPALYTDLNAREYVAWNWDGGGSTVTNTDGTVNSQVRANTTAGFSICTWTGTGNNLTVGHGLGVKPQLYITKARTGSSGCDWFVYHHFFTATQNLRFNQTTAVSSASDLFNNTEPTSSVFSIGDSSCINENGGTYVTYVFSEVHGYSKFGRYFGNGNSNGAFMDLGFKPELIIIKNTTNTHNWRMHDLTRQPQNMPSSTDGHLLEPNNAIAETNEYDLDFLSNGFKIRVNRVYSNNTDSNFAFFAWAKSPFKYSRAH